MNNFPVSARPALPGLVSVVGYLVVVLVMLVAGFACTRWVAERWTRSWRMDSSMHQGD